MKRAKITIIGAGNVGAACAHWAAAKQLGDIVLVDTVEGLAQGKALDLQEAGPIEGCDAQIVGSDAYDGSANSDIVIITAGIPRRARVSRAQLMETNVKIVAEVTAQAVAASPNAVLIVVSGPLEAMVHVASKVSGLPSPRVVGQSGLLNAARYRAFIAAEVGCSVESVAAVVLGGDGDEMVPLPRYTAVAGIPVTQLIAPGRLDEIVTRTRNGAAEILNLLKTSGAYYAPAAASVAMAAAILQDKKAVMPCTAYCKEEYGVGGFFVGAPCVLGRSGVERVIEVELEAREKEMLNASVAHVKDACKLAQKYLPK